MDEIIRKKIENIIQSRKEAHDFYSKSSGVYRSFLNMEAKAFEEDVLSKGQKELIAIGISVIVNCESCLEWHIKKAFEADMTKEQIVAAIGVAIEMGGGPATVASRFAMYVLEYYTE